MANADHATSRPSSDRSERRTNFGRALSNALHDSTLKQTDLSEALRTTQSAVSSWTTGKSEPAAETVFACESLTGVGPGALSRHLGYLPLEAVGARPRVEDLVAESTELDDEDKSTVLGVWRMAARRAQARRTADAHTRDTATSSC